MEYHAYNTTALRHGIDDIYMRWNTKHIYMKTRSNIPTVQHSTCRSQFNLYEKQKHDFNINCLYIFMQVYS